MISVVICTHNRREQLLRLLGALERQEAVPGGFEVLVAADSCGDGTEGAVRDYARFSPLTIRVLSCAARRPAVPRNLGAAAARGDILVFLDDDMIPEGGFLKAHRECQQTADVVVGHARQAVPAGVGFWRLRARHWWEDRFLDMARPAHRFGYTDLFTGNVSVRADLFRSLGGFDESLARLEDYELGLRLVKAGARLAYSRAAVTVHHDPENQERWLMRLGVEAATFEALERKHPEMTGRFHRTAPDATWSGRIRRLAFASPRLVRLCEPVFHAMLRVMEGVKARGLWSLLMGAFGEFTYWRGVAEARLKELPGAVSRGPVTAAATPEILSLEEGRPASMDPNALARATQAGLAITLHGIPFKRIAPVAGCEPLNGRHLLAPLQLEAHEPWILRRVAPNLVHVLPACTLPVWVHPVHLDRPADTPPVPPQYLSVCVVGLWKNEPLGFIAYERHEWESLPPGDSRQSLLNEFQEPLQHLATLRLLERTSGAQPPAPVTISVVVTTDGPPEDLALTLRGLSAQDHPDFEILVAPYGDAARGEVAVPTSGRIRTVMTGSDSLSEARNRSLSEAKGDIVAFLSAGIVPEKGWLEGLEKGFGSPQTGGVVGPILPISIENSTARRYELMWTSPRAAWPGGLSPRELSAEDLVLLEEEGYGSAMAFRRSEVVQAGGFRGCEAGHLDFLLRFVDSGHTLRLEPSAMCRRGSPVHPGSLRALLVRRGRDIGWALKQFGIPGSRWYFFNLAKRLLAASVRLRWGDLPALWSEAGAAGGRYLFSRGD